MPALTLATLVSSCGPSPGPHQSTSPASCEFESARNLGPLVNSRVFDGSPTVSADETELFFTSERKGRQDLFVSTRPNLEMPWSQPVTLSGTIDDTTAGDFSLRLGPDGNELYFASNRSGGFGKADLYVARRASRYQPWGTATNLGPRVNTNAFEAFPTPSADGTLLYFNRSTAFDSQDSDIWVSARSGPGDEWGEAQPVAGGINSEHAEFSPWLSTDGKTLYFASARSGRTELWVSQRADPAHPWGAPQKLGENVNALGGMTLAPFLSKDQRSLYFMSARPAAAGDQACSPSTCFDRTDLYVARLRCR